MTPSRYLAFARAVQALGRAQDRAAVVDAVRQAAREVSGASGISMSLRDGEECVYVAEDADFELWTGQRFALEDCISGWSIMSGQQAIIPDIYADMRVPHAAYEKTPIRSLVMTPIGEPNPFGALGAYWDELDGPQPGDAEMLTALAAVVGSTLRAIDLAEVLRLDRERAERLYRESKELLRSQAEAERHQTLLINELNHRVKNTLTIIQGVARQTLRGATSLDDAHDSFEARLHTLAAAHTLLTSLGWRPVMVRDLLASATAAFEPATHQAFSLDGPDLRLSPSTAVAMALALHELGTNAAKYGALSSESGQVDIRWWLARSPDGPRLRLMWRESGGPPVVPPSRRGFGSRLLESGLARELQGAVRLEFPSTGVICHIDAPAPLPGELNGGPSPEMGRVGA
ncbi:sensor histidine kinase [Phenylobacterium deserti]|nr:HWE histidine kinase domain-containing protein [Phenylobacterium deserti]